MFKTGIAYPIRAEMHGHGVGAERHCVFSTGAFVEPITVWDEPRLLAFGVSGQPPAMEELSIYRNLHPPHLDNYFVAKRGQFELKPLPDGATLLEGTTWYQNRYWPALLALLVRPRHRDHSQASSLAYQIPRRKRITKGIQNL